MSDAAAATAEHHDEEHHGHVVSLQLLTGVFVALLVLTIVTVGVTVWDFGYEVNLAVAMAVALIKALLVALYFMHLRWDAPFNSLILISALAFVTLFIAFCLFDAGDYQQAIRDDTYRSTPMSTAAE